MPGQDCQVRMKLKVLFLILTLNMSLIMSAESFGIVVHGGAGVLSGLSIERQQEIENKVKDTLISAYKILEDGGSSMDAVEFAVSEFEDSTLFNAGKGSVYNSNEVQEMDASIMNGADRSAGAVASVQIIKNPIKLARKVLEETDHVLLVGKGAEIFAKDIEVITVDRSYFHSEKNLKRLKKAKKRISDNNIIEDKIGTVGAVALDKNGNIAAATSTGGMTNKMPGRIGDSPIIGAGTWAENDVCGVSATGHGEFFIRFNVANEICDLIKYESKDVNEAAEIVIENLASIGITNSPTFIIASTASLLLNEYCI